MAGKSFKGLGCTDTKNDPTLFLQNRAAKGEARKLQVQPRPLARGPVSPSP